LARHVKAGPRYTSYPPATEFRQDFDPELAWAELERLGRRELDRPISLYCHIPFCSSLCWYCGCNVTVSRDRRKARPYVEALRAELELVVDAVGHGRALSELALGGGSPNFLPARDLVALTATIDGLFDVLPEAELGIELDPRDTTDDQIDVLADYGYNRLSVGVQDFDPAVQEAIHRQQSLDQTARLVWRARGRGFGTVNVDLVYGLPCQTTETLASTLDAVVSLWPQRIALFGYAHLPHLRRHQRLVERAGPVPDSERRAALVAVALERLAAAGYVRIGIDHFARPNDALARAARSGRLDRNFQGYVVRRADCLIACGATGITDSGCAYWQNLGDVDRWAEAVRAGRLPVARGVRLDEDDRLRRHVIMRLMCDGAVRFADAEERFSVHFADRFVAELDRLGTPEHADLVVVDRDAGELRATALGRNLIRNVCMVFDRYQPSARDAATPRFSPTL
jgi:oxygen-independent coproporphyrinogen-3 oxidase